MSVAVDEVKVFPMTLEGVEGTAYQVEERGKSRVAVHVISDEMLDLMGDAGRRVRRAVDAVNQGNAGSEDWPSRPWDDDLEHEKWLTRDGAA